MTFHAINDMIVSVTSVPDVGVLACQRLQVSLRRSCPGGGMSPRLDASLRAMREIATAWNAGPPQADEWRSRAKQRLEYIQPDFDEAVVDGYEAFRASGHSRQQSALAGPARLTRKVTRVQKKWQPAVVQTPLFLFC